MSDKEEKDVLPMCLLELTDLDIYSAMRKFDEKERKILEGMIWDDDILKKIGAAYERKLGGMLPYYLSEVIRQVLEEEMATAHKKCKFLSGLKAFIEDRRKK